MKVEIVKDSENKKGDRITTFSLHFPRFILPELSKHRVFSISCSSSRAIPSERMMQNIRENTAQPSEWGKEQQKGMNSDGVVDSETERKAIYIWNEARNFAIIEAVKLESLGISRQIVNRLLEPFMFCDVILTATDFKQFFFQRVSDNADPTIRELASLMLETYNLSIPEKLNDGEWHIPLADDISDLETKKKVAVSRCARKSYNTGRVQPVEKDLELYDKLREQGHFVPFEHIAEADSNLEYLGNVKGFRQLRKTFLDENRESFYK